MTAPVPARRPWPRLAALLVPPVLVAVSAGASAVPWLRAVEVHDGIGVLAVAAVAPVALAVLLVYLGGRSPTLSYGCSALGLAVLLLAAVSTHPHVIVDALAHEPARLLTETLPLTGSRQLLTVPLVMVWVCAAVTAEIVARCQRTTAAPVVPVAFYLAAYATTSGAPATDDWTGPVLLASVVALALARRVVTVPITRGPSEASSQPSGRLRRAGRGALVAAVVIAALGYGVPHVGALGRHPAALSRQPAVTSSEVIDPVDAMGSLRDDDPTAPARDLVAITTSGPSTGYFGVATLDDYNGAIWSFDTTLRPTGGRVPAPPAGAPGAGRGGTTVRQTYELLHPYDLPFLPTLDRAQRIEGLGVDIDSLTGMAVPSRPLRYPTTYSVVSDAPDVTLAGLPSGDSIDHGSDAGALADLALPANTSADLAAAIRSLSTLTATTPAPTVAYLQTLQAALRRDERRVVPSLSTRSAAAPVSRGGTSLAEVIDTVTVGRRATPEQFATLFVLVARDLGIPARIVTGFRVTSSSFTSSHPGTRTAIVTNRQAWTWAEIPVAGVGWVVADPTPTRTATATSHPVTGTQAPATTLPPPQANAVPVPTVKNHRGLAPPVRVRVPQPARTPTWLLAVVVAGAVVVVLAALGPGLAALRRRRRRRARRRGAPPASAAGAWLELLDSLDLAGMPASPDATSSEVTRDVGAAFGQELAATVGAVATLADRAVYSVSHPPDADDARAAWETQDVLRRQLRRRLERTRRLRALLPRRAPTPLPDGRRPGAGAQGGRPTVVARQRGPAVSARRRRRRERSEPRIIFEGFTHVVEIGGGAFATVYRAVEVGTERPVALKLLKVGSMHPQLIDAFHAEVRALATVSSHPNIVTLYRAVSTVDGRPVLVLELCRGSYAQRVRATGPLSAAEVIAVGIKIGGALETAHRAGFLHRDMKPQNILVTQYGEPALADFGVATLQASAQATEGIFGFTTLHAPPEVLEGNPLSPATDVYGLASSLYQLLTGRAPFAALTGEAPAAVILRILNDPVPPVTSVDVPMALSDLLAAALAKDPRERPPDVGALADGLRTIAASVGLPPTPYPVWGDEPAVPWEASPPSSPWAAADPAPTGAWSRRAAPVSAWPSVPPPLGPAPAAPPGSRGRPGEPLVTRPPISAPHPFETVPGGGRPNAPGFEPVEHDLPDPEETGPPLDLPTPVARRQGPAVIQPVSSRRRVLYPGAATSSSPSFAAVPAEPAGPARRDPGRGAPLTGNPRPEPGPPPPPLPLPWEAASRPTIAEMPLADAAFPPPAPRPSAPLPPSRSAPLLPPPPEPPPRPSWPPPAESAPAARTTRPSGRHPSPAPPPEPPDPEPPPD